MHPLRAGAFGNFGTSEQWAGRRVFSVICQVHTNLRAVPVYCGTDRHTAHPDTALSGQRRERRRLAQSAPVGVFSSALVVSKTLPLSPKTLGTEPHAPAVIQVSDSLTEIHALGL